MAYMVYFACDECGREGGVWINHSVSVRIATSIARDRGWQVGKRGWICPECLRRKGTEEMSYKGG